MLLIGYQLFQALHTAAMNRALQHKVYLDAATGLPNKNKCEELLDDPTPPAPETGVCSFDLNNLRRINNSMGHEPVTHTSGDCGRAACGHARGAILSAVQAAMSSSR